MPKQQLAETAMEMRDCIWRMVAAGFHSQKEIVVAATEIFSEKQPKSTLQPMAIQLTKSCLTSQLEEEKRWPKVTDCDLLDKAFGELNRAGIVARQNFTCCQTCGVGEIGEEIERAQRKGITVRGYCFYHMQDTERAVDGDSLYLGYGSICGEKKPSKAIANEIIDALQRQGLKTQWNGKLEKRIVVQMAWKRRFPMKVPKA